MTAVNVLLLSDTYGSGGSILCYRARLLAIVMSLFLCWEIMATILVDNTNQKICQAMISVSGSISRMSKVLLLGLCICSAKKEMELLLNAKTAK